MDEGHRPEDPTLARGGAVVSAPAARHSVVRCSGTTSRATPSPGWRPRSGSTTQIGGGRRPTAGHPLGTHLRQWRDLCGCPSSPGHGGGSPLRTGGVNTQQIHLKPARRPRRPLRAGAGAGAQICVNRPTSPYGDRVYTCSDPEDHQWSFGDATRRLDDGADAKATCRHIETAGPRDERGRRRTRPEPGRPGRSATGAGSSIS